ncbi:MAG TPA: hypothetical protein PKJ62_05135 [Bacteroidia bacterium]|nr:hypothetical protein [Bacteroidia bacterium]HNS12583.1 hypothetical protein [Bacteroidia bacterium]
MKKYLSLLFLGLFLFPLISEQVHIYEHSNDERCSTKGTHYCISDHHCTLCDFVQLTSCDPKSEGDTQLIFAYSVPFVEFYQSVVLSQNSFNFSLRAPPALV